MPTYEYSCPSCEKIEERIHSISESPKYKCSECGTVLKRIISHNTTGFIMKYGSPAIHSREKQQRIKKSEKMKKKQEERWGGAGPKVAPNIAGVRTDSWSDAQKMAKEAGMNHESYTPYVEKEKKKKIIV